MSPLILLSNDDGVEAPGIEAARTALADLGEVWVVAPHENRSGTAQSISLHQPLRIRSVAPQIRAVTGTPADCVYVAFHRLLPRRPDLVVCGINHGPNLSFDVHYSGTAGGAREGTMQGVPSIAVSLVDPSEGYAAAAAFTRRLAADVLEKGLPSDVTLNVNVPGGHPTEMQWTFQGHRLFHHSVETRRDPRGDEYCWIGGSPAVPRDLPGSDCDAVQRGVVSVCPLHVFSTHEGAFERLQSRTVEGVECLPNSIPAEAFRLEVEE